MRGLFIYIGGILIELSIHSNIHNRQSSYKKKKNLHSRIIRGIFKNISFHKRMNIHRSSLDSRSNNAESTCAYIISSKNFYEASSRARGLTSIDDSRDAREILFFFFLRNAREHYRVSFGRENKETREGAFILVRASSLPRERDSRTR